jgi:hypothetical protein
VVIPFSADRGLGIGVWIAAKERKDRKRKRNGTGDFLECGGLPPLWVAQIAPGAKAGLSVPHSQLMVLILIKTGAKWSKMSF